MDQNQIVDHLFRTEYGKLVGGLTRLFGPGHLQLAEDLVQETLISALEHWSVGDLPDNPTGWLVQVAKRKALNEIKRKNMKLEHHQGIMLSHDFEERMGEIFLDTEITDNQLRMIFTCCHPVLSVESQIALILKSLCGFGVSEVASALLTTEGTINKRLYRAKKSIRESDIPFEIPAGTDLDQRLETVILTMYLLFNEGYNSSTSDFLIRREFCLEAIRLTRILSDHFPEHKEVFALLSLMYFHVARFAARIDNKGAIVLFEDQDRSLWDQDLINIGMQWLDRSMDKSLTAYHIEAGIAAEHCMAENFNSTNWSSIYRQYQLLEKVKPSPIIQLNLAIIQSKLKGIEYSLERLDELSMYPSLTNYHLLPATQGIFHMQMARYHRALDYLQKVMQFRISASEKKFIESKIAECRRMLLV